MVMELAQDLEAKKINIKLQFFDYSKNQDKINWQEFVALMKSLSQILKDEEILFIFDLMDGKKNKCVHVNKFVEVLQNPRYFWKREKNPQPIYHNQNEGN
jgi:Ca2+-binding EF-hand superfamily protein